MQKFFAESEVVQRLLKCADLLALGTAAFFITLQSAVNLTPASPAIIGFFTTTMVLALVFLLRETKFYNPQYLARGISCALYSWAVAIILAAIFQYLASFIALQLSGAFMPNWIFVCGIYFPISRLLAQLWAKPIADHGHFRRHIAIVGGGKAAEDAIATLERSDDLNIEIIGLFDDRNDNRSPDSVRKHKKLGRINDLADYARSHQVDLIIVAIPMSAELRLLQILKRLWELPIDIRVSGQAAQLKLSRKAYTYLGDLPLLALFDRPLNGWNQFLKNTLDRAIALVAIIAFAPVMAAVACAVRFESKGPIIFKQKRFGFNNELIEVYKFRSMFTDQTDASATKLVTKNDPRVTKVGRIIRKTSLDELPQLFNVITGQLSLVGPRPHATQAKAAGTLYDEVVDGYFARHKVKPGITGWAQVNGWRGETDTVEKLEQRVKHDLDYIDRWSLGLDIYIIAKTPFALLKSENAY
jgi:Undecaprenyl-phosphate glucose phosphotransferase